MKPGGVIHDRTRIAGLLFNTVTASGMCRMFKCKRCQAPTISVFDKYKMGIWQEAYCSNCNARLAANPVVLGAFHFLAYVQMVAWFAALSYLYHDATYLFYIVLFWVMFDILGVLLVPLVVLKPKPLSP